MYESGGEVHWSGHLLILFSLMFLSAGATIFRWHENLVALPFFLYLGYVILKAGYSGAQFVRRLFQKL